MTCIVGFVENDIVYLGGDSASVFDYDVRVRTDQKVFKNGSYIFGFTTSFRMGQLLQYALALPEPPKEDLHRFMCTTFIDTVRDCFKKGGYAEKKDEVETAGTFLVGVNGRLFRIDSNYQVAEVIDNYDAVGCGMFYALGSLATSTGKAKDRVLIALQVAEKFSAVVRNPFVIMSTKD